MTNVISVRFRGGCKTYYFDPRELTVQDGDDVIVETNQGLEFVHCTQGNPPWPTRCSSSRCARLLRLATENDLPHGPALPPEGEGRLPHLPEEDRRAQARDEARARGVQLRQQQDPLLLHRRPGASTSASW